MAATGDNVGISGKVYSDKEANDLREKVVINIVGSVIAEKYAAAGIQKLKGLLGILPKTGINENMFNMSKLTSEARSVLEKFNSINPTIGKAAKELAPKLSKMKVGEMIETLDKDVKAGLCKITYPDWYAPKVIGGKQTQLMYEYTDGTVIRIKPLGDDRRVGLQTYSIEVKINPNTPDNGQVGIAFKVDEYGNAVPKGPQDINNPFPEGTKEANEYVDSIMNSGHRIIPFPIITK
jgi:hypothetical protein